MKTSEQIDKIAPAFVIMQSVLEPSEKTGLNPHFGSAYSTLAAVMEALKKPLSDNGLGIIQTAETKGDKVLVVTRLQHDSGQWYEGESEVEAVQKGPQAYGSAVTYLRRYGAMAITGLSPEDDDANQAESREKKRNEDRGTGAPTKPPAAFSAIPEWRLHREAKARAEADKWTFTAKKNTRGEYKEYHVPSSLAQWATTPPKEEAKAPTVQPPTVHADEDPKCVCRDNLSTHFKGKGKCGVPGCSCMEFVELREEPVGTVTKVIVPQINVGFRASQDFQKAINDSRQAVTLDLVERSIRESGDIDQWIKDNLLEQVKAKREKIQGAA